MHCPKCGKENPEGSRFCMHCGADLSEYKVELSPKIDVSPKISVSAKAEGGVALKWKKKPEGSVEVLGHGKLPLYHNLVTLEDKGFCPLCGNYGCLELAGTEKEARESFLLYCLSCNKYFCCREPSSDIDTTEIKYREIVMKYSKKKRQ